MPINIFLVEDHPLVLHMITEWIKQLPGFIVCGTSMTGADALLQIPQLMPHIVILDLSLPDTSGFTVMKQLHYLLPAIPVLIMSSHDEPVYVQRALALGARGYIRKGNPHEIEPAINYVLSGGIYLSPQTF